MLRCALLIAFVNSAVAAAQSPIVDPAKLTIDRLFGSEELKEERLPAVKWLDNGDYTTLLPSKTHKKASDIVRFDKTGKSEILVSAENFTLPNAKEPLPIQGYSFSKDLDLVLIYTNSVKVWRQNTRGDYWTFRRSTGKLSKLGIDRKSVV